MTGAFVHLPQAPAPEHVCQPPVDTLSGVALGPDDQIAPVGTVWECACTEQHEVQKDRTWKRKRFRTNTYSGGTC